MTEPRHAKPCCEYHNEHCEPPSELCCYGCPEAGHPDHPIGARCVLDGEVVTEPRRVRTQAERAGDDHTLYCGAFQPTPPRRMKPYRCTEPSGHTGSHRAVVDGELVAEWHRLTRRARP